MALNIGKRNGSTNIVTVKKGTYFGEKIMTLIENKNTLYIQG